jgi:hypothetical protein
MMCMSSGPLRNILHTESCVTHTFISNCKDLTERFTNLLEHKIPNCAYHLSLHKAVSK